MRTFVGIKRGVYGMHVYTLARIIRVRRALSLPPSRPVIRRRLPLPAVCDIVLRMYLASFAVGAVSYTRSHGFFFFDPLFT